MHRTALAGLLALGLLASGCSTLGNLDLIGSRKALEESQRRYTQLVRWGEYLAASDYVDPEIRSEFLDHMEGWEMVRFSDYQVRRVDIEDGVSEAEFRVSYLAYHVHSLIEKKVYETQSWYRGKAGWQVRPDLEHLEASLAKLAP